MSSEEASPSAGLRKTILPINSFSLILDSTNLLFSFGRNHGIGNHAFEMCWYREEKRRSYVASVGMRRWTIFRYSYWLVSRNLVIKAWKSGIYINWMCIDYWKSFALTLSEWYFFSIDSNGVSPPSRRYSDLCHALDIVANFFFSFESEQFM